MNDKNKLLNIITKTIIKNMNSGMDYESARNATVKRIEEQGFTREMITKVLS